LKRFALLLALIVAGSAALFGSSTSVQARAKETPTPAPSASALPTPSPEPPDIAIPRLQAKLKANPNDQQSMVDLASQLLGINRPDLSVQLTQRLLQMGDKTSQVYYLDGFAMSALGRGDAAMADLEQAATLDPSNSAVLGQLTDLYLRANRFTDAERIANRSIVLNKGDAGSLSMLGSVYAAEQKFDDARINFEKAALLEPKDVHPIYLISTTYADQNNIPMAITTINRALAVDPKDVQALVFKADLYAKQHDDAKAAPAYDDAMVAATTDSQKASILMRKAAYFAGEKKNAEAEAVYNQGVAQYPKVAEVAVAYGDYWAQQKNYANAGKQWQAALAIDKDNTQALSRLAQLAMQQSKASDAAAYLKHLTDLAPDPAGFAALGQAYSIMHDYTRSKEACAKSFALDKNPGTLGCIAGADFELKNYKEAAQIFDALEKGAHGYLDQNPTLLYIAAKSYQNLNQNAKALNAYKRLLPMMRKGSKDYAEVQATIAMLSKKH
jgi:tetratricopeptide (TPR) repeat protein